MARENQDLQIALIVSVMLTIILGVATFLCYKQYTDVSKSLAALQAEKNKVSQEADKAKDTANKLKGYIGVAETESIDEIDKQFQDDMKKYGAYLKESQSYRPLIENMSQAMQDKDKDLFAAKEENQQWKVKFERARRPRMLNSNYSTIRSTR